MDLMEIRNLVYSNCKLIINYYGIRTVSMVLSGDLEQSKKDLIMKRIKRLGIDHIVQIRVNGNVIYYKPYEDLKLELDSSNLIKKKVVKV